MSLASIVEDFDKSQDTNENQLAAGLLTKENLSLKTEVPFPYEIEVTALVKDVYELVGDLFSDVRIHTIETNDKGEPVYIDSDPIKTLVPNPDGVGLPSLEEHTVKITKPKMVSFTFKGKNEVGTPIEIPFGQAVSKRLINSIGLSEEYAVSHKRKGRLEVAAVLARKFLSHDRHQPQESDVISRMVNR